MLGLIAVRGVYGEDEYGDSRALSGLYEQDLGRTNA